MPVIFILFIQYIRIANYCFYNKSNNVFLIKKSMTQWVNFKGITDYEKASIIMDQYVEGVVDYKSENTILLFEHNEVYTFGASSQENEINSLNLSIPGIKTNRGGKITYHGPGQRIIYPIIDLRQDKDIRKFVKNLEHWIVATLQHFDIEAEIIENSPGVWVKNGFNAYSKIASLGVRLKKWVTYHGVAMNIDSNLSRFNDIEACGIKNLSVTSLKNLNINVTFDEFDLKLKHEYKNFFI